MKERKPTHFRVLKLLGLLAAAVSVAGIVLLITGFGKFESSRFIIGGMMMSFGLVAAFPCLIIGFSPELTRMRVRSSRYIQNENREDLTELANTSAEIMSGAVKTVANAARDSEKPRFCRHCGKSIPEDARFCPACGGQQ